MSDDPIQLNLWDWLAEAAEAVRACPDLVTLDHGTTALDQTMQASADLPLASQLHLAAQALEQLSDILEVKAQQWLDGFAQDIDAAPGLELLPEDLAGLVRQSVSLDYDSFVEPSALKPKRLRPTSDSTRAAPVAPAKLLEMLDQMLSDPQFVQSQLAKLAGGEEPGYWGERIAEVWPEEQAQPQFSLLQAATGLAPVEVWLGLLLRGYSLSRTGDESQFYGSDFVVASPCL